MVVMIKKLSEQFMDGKSYKTNNTCPFDYELVFRNSSNKIFDIMYNTQKVIINDYCLSEKYCEKEVIYQIDKLRDYLKDILDYVIGKYTSSNNRHYIITDFEKEKIINQVVMDILFDKFKNEQDFIYRANYSDYMAEILTELYDETVDPNAVRNALSRQMTNFAEKLKQKSKNNYGYLALILLNL